MQIPEGLSAPVTAVATLELSGVGKKLLGRGEEASSGYTNS
jgi:hypothetical protein